MNRRLTDVGVVWRVGAALAERSGAQADSFGTIRTDSGIGLCDDISRTNALPGSQQPRNSANSSADFRSYYMTQPDGVCGWIWIALRYACNACSDRGGLRLRTDMAVIARASEAN